MSKPTKAQLAERDQARDDLRELVKPGDTVHTILRHVSQSGMTRAIDLVIVGPDGTIRTITGKVGRACGRRYNERWGGLTVGGCGMDMGFHLVYSLSRTLYPEGFDCIGEGQNDPQRGRVGRCPSNDHSNGDRNYNPDNHHDDGGYALNHRWL